MRFTNRLNELHSHVAHIDELHLELLSIATFEVGQKPFQFANGFINALPAANPQSRAADHREDLPKGVTDKSGVDRDIELRSAMNIPMVQRQSLLHGNIRGSVARHGGVFRRLICTFTTTDL